MKENIKEKLKKAIKWAWRWSKRGIFLCIGIFLIYYCYNTVQEGRSKYRDIDGNVESKLKIALKTDSVKEAHEELTNVKKYLEEHNLTTGEVASFYKLIEFHHKRLGSFISTKACSDKCRKCLTESVLARFRHDFEKTEIPWELNWYPNNTKHIIMILLTCLGAVLGLYLIFRKAIFTDR